MRDQYEGLTDLRITKTLAAWVSGLGVGDKSFPPASAEVIGCDSADGVESVVGAHVHEGTYAGFQWLAEIGRRTARAKTNGREPARPYPPQKPAFDQVP